MNRDEAVLVTHSWLEKGLPLPYQVSSRRPPGTVFSIKRLLDELQTVDLTQQDTEKVLAILKGRGLIKSATVSGSLGDVLVEDFLSSFWDFEKSAYVRQKIAHGLQIRRPHCVTSLNRARKHWFPFFEGRHLADLTPDDLRRFCLWISKPEFNLSAATRNRILVVGTTAFKWAYENETLPSDITKGIMTFKGKVSTRGVLTPEEAHRLFQLEWSDAKALLANLLAATTGMRAGEVGGLFADAVGERIQVYQSWSETEGLKPTKNTETRAIPLLPTIKDQLLSMAAKNPHDHSFVFWGPTPKCPYDLRHFNDELQKMLIVLRAGPNATTDERTKATVYWKKRKIDYHAWRHFWSSRMADRVAAEKLMRATGHKSRVVFEGYAGHALESSLTEIGQISGELFGGLIPKTEE